MAKKKEHPIREPKEKASNGTRKPEEKEKPALDKNVLEEMSKRFAIGRQWKELLELAELLKSEPEMAGKLKEALETGRFFITITFQKKYRPDDEHDLHHYWTRKNIMVNDVVPALRHVAADFTARENPTAELPDKENWH